MMCKNLSEKGITKMSGTILSGNLYIEIIKLKDKNVSEYLMNINLSTHQC